MTRDARWFRLLPACCGAVGLSLSAFAAATYDSTSVENCLIVTVDADGATFDPTQLGTGVTNIVKRGAGKLTAAQISDYEGDFRIEQGVYAFASSGDFGKTGAGMIDVMDGASLNYMGQKTGSMSGKTIRLYGKPPSGVKGKITRSKELGTGGGPGLFKELHLMDDDAAFYPGDGNRLVWTKGVIDLHGHTLAIQAAQIQLDCTLTNGGSVAVSSTLMGESDANPIVLAADSAATGSFVIKKNGVLNLKSGQYINGWSLVCEDGSLVQGNVNHKPTDTGVTTPHWDGPISFARTVGLASFEGAWGQSNTVYNVEGPISGSGKLNVGPGWLNLHHATNAYTGAVVVKGMSNNQVPSSSNAPVGPGGGGIGVWNGAPCFPKASSITFTKSARFALMDDVKAELPVFVFTNSTYDQSFTGGTHTNGQRSVSAGLVKASAAALTVDSPVAVTGRVEVATGTLKVARRVKLPNRGLREYNIRSNYNAYNNDIAASMKPWEKTTDTRVTVMDNGVSETGPRKLVSGLEASAKDPNNANTRHGYWYTGYVWNRSKTNETWQIMTDYSNPNITMYLGEGHTKLNFLQQQELDKGKTNLPVQVVLEPGPTRIDLWMFTWAGSGANPSLHNKKGLSFVRGPSQSVADFRAEDSSTWTQFEKMLDDGTGLLFTTDATYPEEDEASYDPLPVFETLDMAAGTTLDLDGNLVFRVGSLGGAPAVTNAPYFAVTNTWTLKSAETNVVLTTDGKLVFAPGSTFAVDDVRRYPRPGDAGRVVARAADGIEGVPEPTSGRWTVEAGLDGKTLVLKYNRPGCVLIFR